MSVHERSDAACSEVDRWFGDVYRDPAARDRCAVFGTPEQVREQLEALAPTGVTHLLLNPVTRYGEQVEALAEIIGLPAH
jgi:alkanesulfonate monooxygenase SsuD/methylene tetrahydromethanopterin reductase-like flavin-dependent oxidoreductase (luciferase family)